MIYSFAVSTPANTLSTAPQRSTYTLEWGILQLKYIVLPPGCAGLVGVAICDALHQIWPTNEAGWFIGEGNFQFDDKYRFYEPPYSLEIYTFNEDDTYAHKPIVIAQLLRPDQLTYELEYIYLNQDILESEAYG